MIKYLSILIFSSILLLIPQHGTSQCKTIANWNENNKGMRTLCFYPSTLRMINLSKDKAFNNMVKDIKKLKITLSENKTCFKKEDISSLKKEIKAENYQDMIMLYRGKESFHVFIKQKNDKPIGFAGVVNSDSTLILIDLEGNISPAVIQQLIAGKVNLDGISKLYDITKISQSNKKQHK